MRTVRFRRFNLRLLVVLAIIAIMATAAYGFAASNTVNPSRAGDGSGGITGYTVSNIHYTMDTSDPALIASVSFHLDNAAGSAQVRFGDNGGNYGNAYSCTAVSGTTPTQDWTCSVPTGDAVTVASVYNLDVAAAD